MHPDEHVDATEEQAEENSRPTSVHCPLCGEFVEDMSRSTQHRQHRIQCASCERHFTMEFHRGAPNLLSTLAYHFVIGDD